MVPLGRPARALSEHLEGCFGCPLFAHQTGCKRAVKWLLQVQRREPENRLQNRLGQLGQQAVARVGQMAHPPESRAGQMGQNPKHAS